MKYNPKAKLKVRQIKDIRSSGGARRVNAQHSPDAADEPRVSQEEVGYQEDLRRYNHLTYSKAYSPVGHVRGNTIAVKNGHYYLKPDPPDAADRTKPRVAVVKSERTSGRRVKITRASSPKPNPEREMPKVKKPKKPKPKY